MKIIFLDTETTDAKSDARLVQLAYKHADTGDVVNEMFKPPVDITLGAMSVCHITNEMVADKKSFEGSEEKNILIDSLRENIMVAHNAPFDVMILNNEGIHPNFVIDTLRVAQHLIRGHQSYKLQYLRYSLELYKELPADIVAHDALSDILVLEKLFYYLFNNLQEQFKDADEKEILQKMINLSNSPLKIKEFTFGKYKGKSFEEVKQIDPGYLQWLYRSETQKSKNDQNRNLVYTLEKLIG
jgi:DNA polymerase III epsilon subunit-like protein